ncbi:MAG: dihydroorotate dehydrogenase [Anaerolineae bacterium]
MSHDLCVNLCRVSLPGPLVLASGIWGSAAATLVRAARAGAGAVTSKSCSLEPRVGHPNPTVLPWDHGLINAVGLTNPGAAEERLVLEEARAGLHPLGAALIASVFGGDAAAYAAAVDLLAPAQPDLIEINVSCPNVHHEFGQPFAHDPRATAEVTRAVRGVWSGPLLVKLSPNTPDLVAVGDAAMTAGADGLTAVNTLGPGMLIDLAARRPVLSNLVGGVSGPAMHPIALRCVYELWAALKAPIVGTGGVSSGREALAMIMAGATAVGIGSALQGDGEAVFARVMGEMWALMDELGVETLAELLGVAHHA